MATNIVISLLVRVKAELGLDSILNSSRDTKLLCLQRFVRLFAYGASTLILALYLSSLGISDARIGLFMTLTLLGDVVISFGLTLFADGLGRRRTMVAGSALMSASGAIFALNGNYWVLVAASIFGVISPRYIVSFFNASLDIDRGITPRVCTRAHSWPVETRSVRSKLLRNPHSRSLPHHLSEAISLHGIHYWVQQVRLAE